MGIMATLLLEQHCLASNAKVAKLVDALDLGSSAARRESSSLSFRTNSFSVHTIKPLKTLKVSAVFLRLSF